MKNKIREISDSAGILICSEFSEISRKAYDEGRLGAEWKQPKKWIELSELERSYWDYAAGILVCRLLMACSEMFMDEAEEE